MPRGGLYLIADIGQVRALASAVRQDIIDVVEASGPVTIAGLAHHMGRPADSLYHHVRLLVRRGLLTMDAGTQDVGRPPALLDVPGRPMNIRYDGGSKAYARAVDGVVRTMLASARRGFSRGLRADLATLTGPHRNLRAVRYQSWLSPKHLQEVNALLERLGRVLLRRSARRTPASRLHGLTWVLSPVPVHERARKKKARA